MAEIGCPVSNKTSGFGRRNHQDIARRESFKSVTPSEFTPRSSFQIAVKTASFSFRSEGNCRFDFPRCIFRCVGTFSPIVLRKSGVEVIRYTAVMEPVVYFTNEYVNMVECFH
jgi:hypothetical protein